MLFRLSPCKRALIAMAMRPLLPAQSNPPNIVVQIYNGEPTLFVNQRPHRPAGFNTFDPIASSEGRPECRHAGSEDQLRVESSLRLEGFQRLSISADQLQPLGVRDFSFLEANGNRYPN